MKLIRAGVITAGVLAGSLALAACGSSGNKTDSGSNPTGSSPTNSSSAPATAGDISCTGAAKLTMDGSTAQANAIAAWEKAYSAKCGNAWTYGGGGSGQGITDFSGGKVDLAGSDAALDPTKGEVTKADAACATGGKAMDLPMVTGPIAVVYNVKGVDLKLTPDLIAKIFTGKITTWNDAAIKAENSGASLPSSKITVFFRSEQSGTTQNFERYMAATAPSIWTKTPSKDWAGVGQGKTGSQGIQQGVSSTPNSISYDEYSYTGGVQTAAVDSGSGAVKLTPQSAGQAVAAAQVASNGNPGDLTLKLDYATKAKGAYPILLVTYEIVCSKYKDPAVGAAVKSFLTYTSSTAGQSILESVGSAPLPQSVLSKVQQSVATIS